ARTLRFVFVLPQFFAGSCIEAAGNLVASLPREHVKLVADQRGRGDAFTDGDLPLLREFLGPGFRRLEGRGLGVAIGTAPLRPILAPNAADAHESNEADSDIDSAMSFPHGSTSWIRERTPSTDARSAFLETPAITVGDAAPLVRQPVAPSEAAIMKSTLMT